MFTSRWEKKEKKRNEWTHETYTGSVTLHCESYAFDDDIKIAMDSIAAPTMDSLLWVNVWVKIDLYRSFSSSSSSSSPSPSPSPSSLSALLSV